MAASGCGAAGPLPGGPCGRRAKIRYRKAADHRGSPQHWRDAVAELVEMQEEYRGGLDDLPDNLAESSMAQALRAV
jgi:hypothetical protein